MSTSVDKFMDAYRKERIAREIRDSFKKYKWLVFRNKDWEEADMAYRRYQLVTMMTSYL